MAKHGPKLGQAVVYRVQESHLTTTVKTNPDKTTTELKGSVFHQDMDAFAGQVTRVHDDGSADLVIFPPNRAPLHVDGVKAGDGAGEFSPA
jgi:hypothetical protein